MSLNDQMRLLQSTWAEILTLTLAYRSLPYGSRLRFSTDLIIDQQTAQDCGFDDLYSQVALTLWQIFQNQVTL